MNVTVLLSSEQAVILHCSWNNDSFKVAIIHGANNYLERHQLWLDLLNHISGPSVCIGDFNAVKGAHERSSDCLPSAISCMDFREFIEATGFIEPSFVGLKFTWSGRRFMPSHVESTIDRALFLKTLRISGTRFIRKLCLGIPLIIRPLCSIEMVAQSWEQQVDSSCPIYVVMAKLNVAARYSHKELLEIQQLIADYGYSEELFDKEVAAQARINTTLSRKHSLLRQKSRVSWLQDGDRNTAFFHKMMQYKRTPHLISHLTIDGSIEYDQTIISNHIVNYFSQLFHETSQEEVDITAIEASIDPMIDNFHNALLTKIPDEEEITVAVFSMDASSSPGPDGFSGKFFQSCWSLIRNDVWKAVRTFFEKSYLPHSCNSSIMVLLPKKDRVDAVGDLRPIVLSNFFYKINPKILASRLSVVAAKFVSGNQFGFISGRSIHDCIMLGSEGVNCMRRTGGGRNMACKIDISKAFDTLRWDFFLKVLKVGGYDEKFIRWIGILLHSARLSILYNGQSHCYFPCSRGFRQGDPLSPILFAIAEDVLRALFRNCVASGHLVPMSMKRGSIFPPHLLFADDILVFCKAFTVNATTIQNILSFYGSLSGQSYSAAKSNFIWTGDANKRHSHTVAWARVCAIKEEGGLGICSFSMMNKCFLMKRAWNIIREREFDYDLMRERYLKTFGQVKVVTAPSSIWLSVRSEIPQLINDSYCYIGTRDLTSFWNDDWLGFRIADKCGVPHFVRDFLTQSVTDYFYDGIWHFTQKFIDAYPDIVCAILILPIGDDHDTRFWKPSLHGEVTSALALAHHCHRFPKVKWGVWIWERHIPVRRSLMPRPWIIFSGDVLKLGLFGLSFWVGLIKGAFWTSRIFIAFWWLLGIASLVLKWLASGKLDAKFVGKQVIQFIKVAFLDIEQNIKKIGCMANSCQDLMVLRNLGVKPRAAPPPSFINIYWWPPPNQWIKVNTDGSALGAPGKIAAGGVFRDKFSWVCGCFHTKIHRT
ncbi:uncharacterized protein LOC131018702 [Salvia miltiorrhiza]|uniref:uncharacterized protein LOC131018702 n=1 Tax=Salvia miltiorrhiza TaxID=226208 RepID=UPI0025AD8C54|nr:uncharacterized protein LOC131018702 [Salvia miltiorrhiza]